MTKAVSEESSPLRMETLRTGGIGGRTESQPWVLISEAVTLMQNMCGVDGFSSKPPSSASSTSVSPHLLSSC